jgi:hypothetical protein
MVRKLFVLNFILFIFSSWALGADTLFEGYYKVTSGDQHIGFSIVRYQFDAKEKKFFSQVLTRISTGGTVVMESIVATADDTLNPISYKYTSLTGAQSKIIDAKFTKGKMTATVKETNKKDVSIKNDIKPGTFLSSFLVYTMLRSPTGIQTNSSYAYTAIAEEDGSVESGTAKVLKEEKFKGFSAFKVENTFKKTTFTTFVTDKGEALDIEVKDARISQELMPQASDAIGTIGLPESVAKTVFGAVPTGEKNVVAQYFKNLQKSPTSGKQGGVPEGQGIMIKGQAAGPSPTTSESPAVSSPKKKEDK